MTALAAYARGAFLELPLTVLKRRRPKEVFGLLALALGCLGLALAFDVLARSFGVPEEAFRENGPIESAQAALVGLAAIGFYVAALRLDFELFYASVVLAPVCGLAIIRETPGCASHFYDGGVCIGDTSQNLASAAFIGLSLVIVAVRREPLARRIADLNFFWVVPSFFAGVLLLIGEAMESNFLMGPEETMETAAYLLLLAFAVLLNVKPQWFDVRAQAARRDGSL